MAIQLNLPHGTRKNRKNKEKNCKKRYSSEDMVRVRGVSSEGTSESTVGRIYESGEVLVGNE